jgi:PAS domain S-box-containing protein
MREYVRRLLAQDFEVEAVPDGQAALESIRVRRPDLVLTDVMMPRLDGFALLRQLRANEQTRTIPIIMLSARAGEESRLEGLDAGADDYLIKPFSARELMARVQSQLELARLRREGEERVTRILDSITDGFHVVDAEGRFTELNAAARTMFAAQGVDVDSMIGRHVFEVFPQARDADAGRALRKALEDREGTDSEAFYAPWNRWYFIRSRPLPEGGVATFFQDITEQKLAEIAMRDSEQRFRALVTASSDVVYCMSADWSEMRDLQGRQFIEDTSSPSRGWLERYIHPEDQPRVMAAIEKAIRDKSTFELEHRVIRLDGTLGWTFSRAIPLLDESGEIREWFGAASDITQSKTAEGALRASEAHLELLSNTVPALISYIDKENHYQSCNHAYTDWFGLAREQVIGRPVWEVLGENVWNSLKPHIEEALGGRMVEFETEAKYRHGGTRWIHATYTPHRDQEGRVLGIVVLVTDISQRKRSEEALRLSGERERILSEALAHLLTAEDTGNVVRDLFPKVAAYLRVDTYLNFMVNDKGDALCLHSCAGIPEETARRLQRLEFGQAICGTVAQTRRPIIANDIQNSDYDKAALVRAMGIQCYACNPLMSGERLLGTLSFASRTRPAFEESELEFLRIISNYVAIALERSRAMRALGDAQQQLDIALRASGAATWGWNILEQKLDEWTPAYREMYGFSPDIVPTFDAWIERVHPHDRERLKLRIHAALATPGDDTWNEEFRILHPETGERWIGGLGHLFRDSSGRAVRISGVNFDITDRKRVELALHDSQRTLSDDYAGLSRLHAVASRFVTEGNFQALLEEIVDAAIAVTHAQKGKLQLLKSDSGRLDVVAACGFSKTWWKYFNQVGVSSAATSGQVLQHRRRVIVEDITSSDLFVGTPALSIQLGENVRAVQSTPLISRTGELLGVVSTHFSAPHRPTERELHWLDLLARQAADLIERHRSEEALKRAQEELRRHAVILEEAVADRTAKLRETVAELESFSYSIAHDMRAPLRSMRGFAGILEAEHGQQLGADARDFLRRISASAERLDRLIQDVLNYSKVVRGDIPLESVETEKLLREIVESYSDFQPPLATVLVQTPLPNVRANPAALTQVISNLLSNAVKFVQPGVTPRIIIRAERHDDVVRLWFEDNGIGIPSHAVDRIFKMFQRLHPPGTYDGTGIGLAIIRKAVDRMGGRVGVESELDRGSRFWVELQKA